MFSIPGWGDNLTFKGGTSLSKCWGLIKRFSEDIDLVIDKGFLGFGSGERPEDAPSIKQRKKRLDAMKKAAQERIHGDLAPLLAERISASLSGSDSWDLRPASHEDDPDGQTLLFTYPSANTQADSYIRQAVKIEMGARPDNEPVQETDQFTIIAIIPAGGHGFPFQCHNMIDVIEGGILLGTVNAHTPFFPVFSNTFCKYFI